MGNFPRDTVGRNVKKLRLYLHLSLSDFANYAGVSKTSIVNIESGLQNYSTGLLDDVLAFLDVSWTDIIKIDLNIPLTYKKRLIEKHERLNLKVILKDKPPINYAIRNFLIKGSLLNIPRERKDIISFFESLGWQYNANAVTQALKRCSDLINIQTSPTRRNVYLYSKRK
jgi:transcriptional regulator with XRE-family HTH domain